MADCMENPLNWESTSFTRNNIFALPRELTVPLNELKHLGSVLENKKKYIDIYSTLRMFALVNSTKSK